MDKGLVWSMVLGLFIRILFMIYGIWQDNTMKVKYTDVDYHVFTDAAKFVTQAESPYQRATYRYTPILAWILTPNIYCTVHFGKVVFIICDIIASLLLFKILRMRGVERDMSLLCAHCWLFNPLPITVSSRGNAESVMAVLVLATLYCLTQKGMKHFISASILYGISVHMKIYPVIYALPMYLYMNSKFDGQKTQITVSVWYFKKLEFLPTKSRLIFGLGSGSILIGLTWLCYNMYGEEFLQETYLYHVTRKDTRHNFSPYFYMFYLSSETDWAGLIGLLAFLPQALGTLLVSLAYYQDLPFCCFLQTFIFVTFNKVCTSQYFLWYLCLLPLIIPQLRVTLREGLVIVAAWFVGQALFLAPAYYLEFEGKQSFIWIWAAGLIFFIINIAILQTIIKSYIYHSIYPGEPTPQNNTIKIPHMWKKLFSTTSNGKPKLS